MSAITFAQYQRQAVKTCASHLDHHTGLAVLGLGLAGESGEVIELIKKMVGHGHPVSTSTIEAELGDVMWYMANIAEWFDLDLAVIAAKNNEKLAKRFPDGFSSEASIARADVA